jgi:hypothetical protein
VTRTLWTIANAIMMLAFLFSVIVQFNDPDPLTWSAIYGAAMLVCAFELRRRVHPLVPAAIALVALIWAATIAPRVLGQVPFSAMFAAFEMKNAGVEESREMYGLVLIALGMIAVASAAWRRRSATVRPATDVVPPVAR